LSSVMGVTLCGLAFPLALWAQRCCRSLHVRALTSHTPIMAVVASDCSYKQPSYLPTTWHSICSLEESITRLLLGSLSIEASRVSVMYAAMDIVSLRSPEPPWGFRGPLHGARHKEHR
jgi:hypothetical protein